MNGSVITAGCAGRRLVFRGEIERRLGVSYPTLMKMVKEGKIAAPRMIGTVVAWTDVEVEACIDGLPKGWPRGRGRPRKVK